MELAEKAVPPMRVLVVDDDEYVRRMVKQILAKGPYELFEAAHAEEGWQQLRTRPIPLLIVDWMMPGMSGVELVRRIRAASFPYYHYILMLTAKGTTEDLVEGLEAGADDYLIKPFDHQELRARLAIGKRIVDLESNLRAAMERLAHQATYDALTGLYNRQAVMNYAQQELNRTQRNGGSLCLCLLDIDHFKQVNDEHGHLVGDQALRWVASLLSDSLRSYDRVGRWGGEEFLVVLPDTSLESGKIVAERIRQRIANSPLDLPDAPIQLHASLGLVMVPASPVMPLDRLFQRVDEALYLAKEQGRNRVETLPLPF